MSSEDCSRDTDHHSSSPSNPHGVMWRARCLMSPAFTELVLMPMVRSTVTESRSVNIG